MRDLGLAVMFAGGLIVGGLVGWLAGSSGLPPEDPRVYAIQLDLPVEVGLGQRVSYRCLKLCTRREIELYVIEMAHTGK